MNNKNLTYYLAQEQEIVKTVQQDTFFTWIVPPTVIYGKHQLVEQEVNLSYCTEHHIAVVQRQSGGGCVYADDGNLMLSFVTPSTHSEQAFHRFLNSVAQSLCQMGYNAVTTEHNDILVDNHKVAGFACCATPTGTIVHACMLYDVNLEHLEQAITPTAEKLAKHAVKSVRQRVKNLREWRDWGKIEMFQQEIEKNIRKNLCI